MKSHLNFYIYFLEPIPIVSQTMKNPYKLRSYFSSLVSLDSYAMK